LHILTDWQTAIGNAIDGSAPAPAPRHNAIPRPARVIAPSPSNGAETLRRRFPAADIPIIGQRAATAMPPENRGGAAPVATLAGRVLAWLAWPLRLGYSLSGSVLAFVLAFFRKSPPRMSPTHSFCTR